MAFAVIVTESSDDPGGSGSSMLKSGRPDPEAAPEWFGDSECESVALWLRQGALGTAFEKKLRPLISATALGLICLYSGDSNKLVPANLGSNP